MMKPRVGRGRSSGHILTMWHGTPAGGFSHFRGATFFAPSRSQALAYTRRGVGAAQATPAGHSGEPELLEVRVAPGRVFDLSTAEGRAALEAIYKDPVFLAGERDEARLDEDYFTPSIRSILESSWTARGFDRVQTLPFSYVRWLAPHLARHGFDSVLVSEGQFQSLYVLRPEGRVEIVGRERV